MSALYPGRGRDELGPQEVEKLNEIVTSGLQGYRADFISEQAPRIEAEQSRRIEYLETISAFLVLLQLGQRSFRLSLRVVTPM